MGLPSKHTDAKFQERNSQSLLNCMQSAYLICRAFGHMGGRLLVYDPATERSVVVSFSQGRLYSFHKHCLLCIPASHVPLSTKLQHQLHCRQRARLNMMKISSPGNPRISCGVFQCLNSGLLGDMQVRTRQSWRPQTLACTRCEGRVWKLAWRLRLRRTRRSRSEASLDLPVTASAPGTAALPRPPAQDTPVG